MLLHPTRSIYIHRQTKSKNAVDYCVDPQSTNEQKETLARAITECDRSNAESIEKGVASQLKTVVKFNQAQEQYDMSQKLEKEKEKGSKNMPFVAFDKEVLAKKHPSAFGAGRSTKPSVSVQKNARITFSSQVAAVLAGCTVILPGFDREANKLRFDGFPVAPKGKENKVWDISRPKDGKNKSASIAGAIILKEVGYDYTKAGNQTYEVEKIDAEKHTIVFALPKETPKPKPVVVRVKKDKTAKVNGAAAGVAVAGADASTSTAPATSAPQGDDDVLIDS